jgi:hypothetical protein
MTTFSLSLPRGIKSPVKTSRFSPDGIRMPFFKNFHMEKYCLRTWLYIKT